MSNPTYITTADGEPLITDKLLLQVFSEIIDNIRESSAEVGEDIFSRQEWLALIKQDIARISNKLPRELDELNGGGA